MPQFLNSIPLLPCSYPGKLASWNSNASKDLLCPFYNLSARTAQKTVLLLLRVFASAETCLLSCSIAKAVHVISFHHNSSIVECGYYLATAVFLALQFLLWANTPQYHTSKEFVFTETEENYHIMFVIFRSDGFLWYNRYVISDYWEIGLTWVYWGSAALYDNRLQLMDI
jgi:hypothetical protein